MSFTQEECCLAIEAATNIINQRTENTTSFTWGYNDCANLLIEYDRSLRQGITKADLPFEWSGTKDFLVKLKKHGYSMQQYIEHCGYKIVNTQKPQIGDVSFEGGCTIAGPDGWISITESNQGVRVHRQMMFLERRLIFLARPEKG